jgi:hypothetical protein
MAQEKRVLLARPHAFIVDEMRPFLVESGYTPVKVATLDEFKSTLSQPLYGAVVSTAVSSSIGADAATVFSRLREIAPQLPVMFAGMADFASIRLTAGRAVAPVISDAVFHEAAAWPMRFDRRREFLVLRKEDLTSADVRQQATRALRALFG